VRAARARLLKDPDKPLLSRAAQELFPPGSTFKLVTAAAALENGMKPDTKFPNPPALKLPTTTHELHNFGGEHCLGGAAQLTLAQALEVSCNVVFGEIGLKLGAEKLVEQAQRFGFDQQVPLEIPFATGRIPPVKDFANALPAVAFSAIGQQSVGANPLQMALVGGAIANGGVEMEPRLVKEIRDPSGRVIKSFGPKPWGRPISDTTARQLTQMMIKVVESGTGTAAQIPGVTVAGKTGTAETTSGKPHAWFVCFAPAQNPKIVVAVMVLNGGSLGSEATGGHVAAPIARAVVRAALGA
jgi:peptidoglycan glycosyltransferase